MPSNTAFQKPAQVFNTQNGQQLQELQAQSHQLNPLVSNNLQTLDLLRQQYQQQQQQNQLLLLEQQEIYRQQNQQVLFNYYFDFSKHNCLSLVYLWPHRPVYYYTNKNTVQNNLAFVNFYKLLLPG